jgi:transposase
MICNAIFSVCKAYKSQVSLGRIAKDKPIPKLSFRNASVHFDKRTYSLTKSGHLSLYTLSGRIKVALFLGKHQKKLFSKGIPKEAELIYKEGEWYFNLVLDLPDTLKVEKGVTMGVDVGENNLAATSTGKIFGGGRLRDRRDRFLSRRGRLQSNGSQSAKSALRKASGRESRHVKYVNHEISKAIITEAKQVGASCTCVRRPHRYSDEDSRE